MASGTESSDPLNLEQLRIQLEKNVVESRALLQQWQTWEAEYEAIKEELTNLEDEPKLGELESVPDKIKATLLTRREIKTLFEDGKGNSREVSQVLGMVSRRIDYVRENVKAAEKRRNLAEERLEAANIVELRDETGLPFTEIVEELDDNDNVISTTLSKPGSAAPQIIEALRQSGVTDISGQEPDSENEGRSGSAVEPNLPLDEDPQHRNEVHTNADLQKERKPPNHKKKVSFANDPVTKIEDTCPGNLENLASKSLTSGQSHTSIPDERHPKLNDFKDATSEPIIPNNETPEQVSLRREMLEYNLNEVGAIVAEMNLDDEEEIEDDSEFYSSNSDNAQDGTDEDDEDQFGRTTKQIVGDDYKTQMLELERKLNAKALTNVGPAPAMSEAQSLEAKIFKPRTNSPNLGRSKDTSTSTKKGVRFAENFDIQEALHQPLSTGTRAIATESTPVNPIASAIVERNVPDTTSSREPKRLAKPSRFKVARAGPSNLSSAESLSTQSNSTISNGPLAGLGSSIHLFPASRIPPKENVMSQIPDDPPISPQITHRKTHADVLVERSPNEANGEIQEPDEFDPALMHQGIAVEYHRMRNRMIQRNGGFTNPENDEAEESLLDGGPRRVSRFKAARLGRVDR